MATTAGRTRAYAINKLGRDFALGDIHGAYDMVREGLRQARFNPRLDRLFSVGDLIDRGADSGRALEFLAQPWFHAVRGNHDDDFATLSVAEIRHLASSNWNGLGWALGASDELIEELRRKCSRLPLAIEVATRRGSVGLVHGDVPAGMSWPDFLAALEARDPAAEQAALWGRDRIQQGDHSGVEGVGRVFVGHTIQWAGPKRLGNVYAIDTGAVFHELGAEQGALTMVNLMCASARVAPGAMALTPAAVWTLPLPAAGPFGAYAVKKKSS